ncbi:SRPBCC domain-containing protein [Pseudonocardia lacus]|uniref:SRPBCC domain-containing protein n=1 Tax=Pseudonocardia lacus TaxID=2835865 RepID=UPI0027E28459|nr:SRPBCC domain-containing protein [Pseudonocardia lacus]
MSELANEPSDAVSELVVESVTVEIDAPAGFVWAVLVDYERYPEWNPYTVAARTTLAIGSPIELDVPNPDGSPGTFVNREYIRVVEPPSDVRPGHLRYDTGEEIPGIHGVRDQHIEPLGPDRCAYRTTDTFSGKYAGSLFASHGRWVKQGFDAVAHALKARAESLRPTP